MTRGISEERPVTAEAARSFALLELAIIVAFARHRAAALIFIARVRNAHVSISALRVSGPRASDAIYGLRISRALIIRAILNGRI